MSLLALKDLFARHRARATGLWRLGQEPNRTVFLEAGDVVFAVSTHPLDRLTHLLVERGKLTQAQLDYAMANLDPAMSIGKNLIVMGFITQRDLLDVARAQVERVVGASVAAPDAVPAFEAKELDATTVRLPFDTPAMLLASVLNLQDREGVLEELGPLNQVVVLEGRRYQELALPSDLVRLPGLLDGSRTLLELSREAGVEPFRLGAFALFLREMGWARLHELPPLDRRAVELALEPEAPVVTPPLPEPPPVPQPSLFAEIHASQRPTTNLEHLSESLDELGPEDEVEEPLRTVPLPPDPEPPVAPAVEPPSPAESEPAMPIHHAMVSQELPPLTDEEPKPAQEPARRKGPLALLGVAALIGILWFTLSRSRKASPPPAPAAPSATEAPASKPPAPAAEAARPAPEPAKAPEPEKPAEAQAAPTPKPGPAPKPEPPSVPSKADRLQSLLQADLGRAATQGAAQRKALQGRWSLRLEIACQGTTIQHAAELLKTQDPDLFLVPMAMRDGRTCYQIFFGSYGSEAAAKEAARKLPPTFHAEGNRPKPFRVAQIADHQ